MQIITVLEAISIVPSIVRPLELRRMLLILLTLLLLLLLFTRDWQRLRRLLQRRRRRQRRITKSPPELAHDQRREQNTTLPHIQHSVHLHSVSRVLCCAPRRLHDACDEGRCARGLCCERCAEGVAGGGVHDVVDEVQHREHPEEGPFVPRRKGCHGLAHVSGAHRPCGDPLSGALDRRLSRHKPSQCLVQVRCVFTCEWLLWW